MGVFCALEGAASARIVDVELDRLRTYGTCTDSHSEDVPA